MAGPKAFSMVVWWVGQTGTSMDSWWVRKWAVLWVVVMADQRAVQMVVSTAAMLVALWVVGKAVHWAA